MPRHRLPMFYLDLPGGWEDHTNYMFMGPHHVNHQHVLTLNLVRNPGQKDLEEFGRERVAALVSASGEQDVVKEGIVTLPSGQEAYEYVYKWVPSNDRILFKRFVYLLIDKVGYVFSIDFTKPSLKTVGLEVMQLIDSLTPIKDAS